MGRSVDERVELKLKAGEYGKSLLNDLKLADGSWLTSVKVGDKTWFTRSFMVWQGIRSRCAVGGSFQRRFPHYVGTTVCQEWQEDFQAFANWYTSQIGYKEGWDVDKDALSGNKHYSPDTCVLLPRAVNLLFGQQWLRSGTTVDEKLKVVAERREEYAEVNTLVFDALEQLVQKL